MALRFGKRAKKISNKAKANKERTPEEMRRYIEVLEAQLEEYKAKEQTWLAGGGVVGPPLPRPARSDSDSASPIVVSRTESGDAEPSAAAAAAGSEAPAEGEAGTGEGESSSLACVQPMSSVTARCGGPACLCRVTLSGRPAGAERRAQPVREHADRGGCCQRVVRTCCCHPHHGSHMATHVAS